MCLKNLHVITGGERGWMRMGRQSARGIEEERKRIQKRVCVCVFVCVEVRVLVCVCVSEC